MTKAEMEARINEILTTGDFDSLAECEALRIMIENKEYIDNDDTDCYN